MVGLRTLLLYLSLGLPGAVIASPMPDTQNSELLDARDNTGLATNVSVTVEVDDSVKLGWKFDIRIVQKLGVFHINHHPTDSFGLRNVTDPKMQVENHKSTSGIWDRTVSIELGGIVVSDTWASNRTAKFSCKATLISSKGITLRDFTNFAIRYSQKPEAGYQVGRILEGPEIVVGKTKMAIKYNG